MPKSRELVRRMHIPKVSSLFPHRVFSKFLWTTNGTIGDGAAPADGGSGPPPETAYLYTTSLIDPGGDFAGTKAVNAAVWATLYTYYNIRAAKITMTVKPSYLMGPKTTLALNNVTTFAETLNTGGLDKKMWLVFIPSTSTTALTDPHHILNHDRATKYLIPTLRSGKSRKISLFISHKKFWKRNYNDTQSWRNVYNDQTAIASNSTYSIYTHMYLIKFDLTDATTNALALTVDMRMTQYVELSSSKYEDQEPIA